MNNRYSEKEDDKMTSHRAEDGCRAEDVGTRSRIKQTWEVGNGLGSCSADVV